MILDIRFLDNENRKKYLSVCAGETIYTAKTPVELTVISPEGLRTQYAAGYDKTVKKAGFWEAKADIYTRNGSRFRIRDRYDINRGELVLSRKVDVLEENGHDAGFSTTFAIGEEDGRNLEAYDAVIPGIWYGKNDKVIQGALGSLPRDRYCYIRITRMALPYVELFRTETGNYAALKHLSPVPTCGAKECSAADLTDEMLQYASMGLRCLDRAELCYHFPGSEGETTYLAPGKKAWAGRFHPVRRKVRHEYALSFLCGEAKNTGEALQKVWRYYFEQQPPAVKHADMKQVYEDGMELLDVYCQEYNGVMGLPFWTKVPEGTVCDISFQMGFVGQQTMCAYQLIRDGYRRQNKNRLEKGKKIIDFWVRHSTKTSVIPRVWYNVFPASFKEDYPTYTRTAADGMEGILACCQFLRENGERNPEWEDFCITYAQWLTENQNQDGSWYRAYDEQGEPVHTGKYNTSNVIRFLVNMYWLTEDRKYLDSADRAGKFCYNHIYRPMAYVGGTADNDNTVDKEAGMIALYAFLSLYQATWKEEYLEAAKGAADFCETWTYSWSYPVKPYKGNAVFDRVDFTGLSLIATGHSHCDVMMAYMSFEYYCLWRFTKDRHYLDFARFIHENTKQTVDWERKLKHAYPGLVEESGELALQYHNGLGKWLPWCTIAEIEPLTRFEEKFGSLDMPEDGDKKEDHTKEKQKSSWVGSWIPK